jgi:hypothetical protein
MGSAPLSVERLSGGNLLGHIAQPPGHRRDGTDQPPLLQGDQDPTVGMIPSSDRTDNESSKDYQLVDSLVGEELIESNDWKSTCLVFARWRSKRFWIGSATMQG